MRHWTTERIGSTVVVHDWFDATIARWLGTAVAIEHRRGAAPHAPTHPGLSFSLARRGDWVVAACSDAPIGVDIERIDRAGMIPYRVLHVDERRWIDAVDAHDRFYTLWTAKEAYAKAHGWGLSIEPSGYNCLVDWARFEWCHPATDVVACCYR